MSDTVKNLLPTLLALPECDRELIAEVMSGSLTRSDDVDPEFLAMLNRRIEEIKSGRVAGIPADVVMEEARRQYP